MKAYCKLLFPAMGLCMLLSGCGKAAEPANDALEKPASAPTIISSQTIAEQSVPSVAQAKELIGALNTIDKLAASAVSVEKEKPHQSDNGAVYYRYTGKEFVAVQDVRALLNKSMTADFVAERYASLLEGDQPICLDVEGALYVQYRPKGGGFAFTETEPLIEKTSEDGYSILAEYDDYGKLTTLEIRLVLQDGQYLISGVTFGE